MTDIRGVQRPRPTETAYWTPVGPAVSLAGRRHSRSRIFFTVVPSARESPLARDWLALLSDVPADACPVARPRGDGRLVFWRLVRGNTPLALGTGVAGDLESARALALQAQHRADEMLVAPLFDARGANTGWYVLDGDRAMLRGLPGVQLRPVRSGETPLSRALSAATLERYVHHAGLDPLDGPLPPRRPAFSRRAPVLLGGHPDLDGNAAAPGHS